MAGQFVAVAPDSTGKKVQTFENTVGSNLVEAQAMCLVDQFGVPLAERADNWLRVQIDPTTLLFEPFSALDTTNTWTAGGTAPPSVSGGVLALSAGTTAGASSWLASKPAFLPGASAYLEFAGLLQIETAAVSGNQRFWGLGVIGTPSLSAPVTNGVVFEIDSASGGLLASTYSNGARTQSVALTRPADGALHRYVILFRSSRAYFEIDGVAAAQLPFPNPAAASLAVSAGSVNGGTALAAGTTLNVSQFSLGDTARNNHGIADALFPWRGATVKPGSTAAAPADTGLVVTPHPSGTQTVQQASAANLNATAAQGAAGSLATAWLVRTTDGTNIAGVNAKGTQGAFAIATQDLRDAGRNAVALYMALPVLATAADTLQSLTGFKGGGAVAATTTPAVVSAGKTFRISSIECTYVATATAGLIKFTLRAQAGGLVAIGSNAVMSWFVGAPAAVAGVVNTVSVPLPDGLEFVAGTGLGISILGLNATMAATASLGYGGFALAGFEY